MTQGTEVAPAAAAPLPKEVPEALVLRARPRPVVKFRKSLLVGIAAISCAGLAGLAWVALESGGLRMGTEELADRPVATSKPEALSGAPSDYSDVPQLGPPLPGDLGAPILAQQRKMASEPATDHAQVSSSAGTPSVYGRVEEEQAARTSGLFSTLTDPASRQGGVGGGEPTGGAVAAQETDGAPQQRKIVSAEADIPGSDRLLPPPSSSVLFAGTIVPASLVTGLNSDLPGLVVAQVTQDVRDSVTGRTVLIPQGARLIGEYDSKVTYGQRRALLLWSRIIFPNGSSVSLDNMPATDAAGFSGVEGRVDAHGWQLAKGVLLSSLLGLGSEFRGAGDGDIARAIRDSAQESGSRAGERLVARELDVKPTLVVPPGWPVRLLITRDLLLDPWNGGTNGS